MTARFDRCLGWRRGIQPLAGRGLVVKAIYRVLYPFPRCMPLVHNISEWRVCRPGRQRNCGVAYRPLRSVQDTKCPVPWRTRTSGVSTFDLTPTRYSARGWLDNPATRSRGGHRTFDKSKFSSGPNVKTGARPV
ncbi:hypothetical protein IG631_15394 [Alternaria alternata]|nr:hypothetical protein IG631_15394 [Alternaria alternata]